jgi:hypothetical protein
MLSIGLDSKSVDDHSNIEIQLHMILSKETLLAGNSSRALKFLGDIHDHAVVMLVDSMSSYSFVNERIARSLLGVSTMSKSVQIQVANGQVIQSSSEIKQAAWSI